MLTGIEVARGHFSPRSKDVYACSKAIVLQILVVTRSELTHSLTSFNKTWAKFSAYVIQVIR
jgi:hypothetical protein